MTWAVKEKEYEGSKEKKAANDSLARESKVRTLPVFALLKNAVVVFKKIHPIYIVLKMANEKQQSLSDAVSDFDMSESCSFHFMLLFCFSL